MVNIFEQIKEDWKNKIMAKAKTKKTKKRIKRTGLGYISLTRKILLTKNLAVMIKSGVPINEALEVAVDQATGKMQRVLKDVNDQVVGGMAFGDALARHPKVFSKIYVSLIRVGETSGNLAESLEELSVQLDKDNQLRVKVMQAMLYPIIVLLATIFVGGGVSIFVLPRLQNLFAVFQGSLPLATKILLGTIDILTNYGLYIFIGLAIAIPLIIWGTRIKFIKPIWHRMILAIPFFGKIVKDYNLARFNYSLGVLLKSGIPITDALEIVADVLNNEVYRRKTELILEGVKKGGSMYKTMKEIQRIFPGITGRMVNVGEKTGKLDEVLPYLADFYESEVDRSTKNLSTTLEPILLVIIGLVVGFVMIAIITPIYELTGLIAEQ